jgi:hypothetical protein
MEYRDVEKKTQSGFAGLGQGVAVRFCCLGDKHSCSLLVGSFLIRDLRNL